MNYLYAAYAATWIIHIGYLLYLTRAFQKVKEEIEELNRE
ncbi:MAG: CcmD family protein [Candidatus Korobacteraceae bacterium]